MVLAIVTVTYNVGETLAVSQSFAHSPRETARVSPTRIGFEPIN